MLEFVVTYCHYHLFHCHALVTRRSYVLSERAESRLPRVVWLLCIAIYYSWTQRLGFIPGSYRYNYFEPEAWENPRKVGTSWSTILGAKMVDLYPDSSSEEDERVARALEGVLIAESPSIRGRISGTSPYREDGAGSRQCGRALLQ